MAEVYPIKQATSEMLTDFFDSEDRRSCFLGELIRKASFYNGTDICDVLSPLPGGAENKRKYKSFYKAHSHEVKFAVINGSTKDMPKSVKLLLFHSTKSGNEMISLKDYVARMEEGQSVIYYITGESKEAVENSPLLEKLKENNYEILFMVDDLDWYIVRELEGFEGMIFSAADAEV